MPPDFKIISEYGVRPNGMYTSYSFDAGTAYFYPVTDELYMCINDRVIKIEIYCKVIDFINEYSDDLYEMLLFKLVL